MTDGVTWKIRGSINWYLGCCGGGGTSRCELVMRWWRMDCWDGFAGQVGELGGKKWKGKDGSKGV